MEDNYNKWSIAFMVIAIIVGIITGINKQSFWWGIGSSVGVFVVGHLAYWLGEMLDGIEYNMQHKDENYKQ